MVKGKKVGEVAMKNIFMYSQGRTPNKGKWSFSSSRNEGKKKNVEKK